MWRRRLDAATVAPGTESFTTAHQQWAPLCGRAEARCRSEQDVRGLLVQQTDRRNAANLTACRDGASPRSLQRFRTEAPGAAAAVRAALQTFRADAAARGAALVDRRLSLPACRTDARSRCQAAGVPDAVGLQTTPAVALALLLQGGQRGPCRRQWVTADAGYGQVPECRAALAAAGWWDVLAVPCTTRVFAAPARAAVPPRTGHGRPPTRP